MNENFRVFKLLPANEKSGASGDDALRTSVFVALTIRSAWRCHRDDIKNTLKVVSSKIMKGGIINVLKGRNQKWPGDAAS